MKGREAPRGAPTGAQDLCRSVLLAPLGARGDRVFALQPAKQDPVRQMLVVWAK